MLVTGGFGVKEHLSSTEVYRPSAGEWKEVPDGALPRPMRAVRVVTLNNRVLLFGEKIILTEGQSSSICIYQVAKTKEKVMQTFWSSLTPRGRRIGSESGKCPKLEVSMESLSWIL